MNPERAGQAYGKAAAAVLTILMAVGAVGHLQPSTLPWMLKLTPGFGMLTGLVVLAPALAQSGRKFAAWVAGTYGFTFAAEAAGVATARCSERTPTGRRWGQPGAGRRC